MEENIKKFWHGRKKQYFILLYLSDVISFAASAYIISSILNIDFADAFYTRFYLFGLLMLIILYSNYGLYNNKRNLFSDDDFMHVVYSNIVILCILGIFTLMFNRAEPQMLIALVLISATTIIITTIGRVLFNDILYIARQKGYDVKKTIFFGEEDNDLICKLKDRHLGYNIIKVTSDIEILKSHLQEADIVFIKMQAIDDEMLDLITANDHINWKIMSSILNLVIEPVAFDEFKDYPIINVSNGKTAKNYKAFKRLTDIAFSGIILILLLPLFAVVSVLIKITMPGPLFYTQERLGENLTPFRLYKFRSMKVNADSEKSAVKNEVKGLFKAKNDPRITPFGKIIRRTCIDELPQLINIFIGDMSIVGPRPHLRSELPNFCGWRMARFNVKPGLTGLWQVNGRHELNFDKAVLYDIYYVKHMSLILDMTIILKTIPAIIMNKGKF